MTLINKTPYKRILAAVTAVIFLFTGIAYPETGTTSASAPQKPKIYLIGDIHTHYEVQKQIISHIRKLNTESGVNLIFTEGSFGYVDLSGIDIFRQVAGGQEAIEKVAEKYLKAGKIAADEYVRIADGPKYDIFGVDDMKLYKEVAAYFSGHQSDQAKEESLKVNAQREKAMIDNLAHEMALRKEKAAFMTTGTFHVRRIAAELKKKGFDVVILPVRYDDNFDKDRYKDILERNQKLKMYWEVGLKLTALAERADWQELQGEVLETAVKNAYSAGGITAVKVLIGQVNTLAQAQNADLGPFSVVENSDTGLVYVVGKNILTVVNRNAEDDIFARDAVASGISRYSLHIGGGATSASIFIPTYIANAIRTDADLALFLAKPDTERQDGWTALRMDINIADMGINAPEHAGVNGVIKAAAAEGRLEYAGTYGGKAVYKVLGVNTLIGGQKAHAGIERNAIYVAEGAYSATLVTHEAIELQKWQEKALELAGMNPATDWNSLGPEQRESLKDNLRLWMAENFEEAYSLEEQFHTEANAVANVEKFDDIVDDAMALDSFAELAQGHELLPIINGGLDHANFYHYQVCVKLSEDIPINGNRINDEGTGFISSDDFADGETYWYSGPVLVIHGHTVNGVLYIDDTPAHEIINRLASEKGIKKLLLASCNPNAGQLGPTNIPVIYSTGLCNERVNAFGAYGQWVATAGYTVEELASPLTLADINIADIGMEAPEHKEVNDAIALAASEGRLEAKGTVLGKQVYVVKGVNFIAGKQRGHAGIARNAIYIAEGAYDESIVLHEAYELQKWQEKALELGGLDPDTDWNAITEDQKQILREFLRQWMIANAEEAIRLEKSYHEEATSYGYDARWSGTNGAIQFTLYWELSHSANGAERAAKLKKMADAIKGIAQYLRLPLNQDVSKIIVTTDVSINSMSAIEKDVFLTQLGLLLDMVPNYTRDEDRIQGVFYQLESSGGTSLYNMPITLWPDGTLEIKTSLDRKTLYDIIANPALTSDQQIALINKLALVNSSEFRSVCYDIIRYKRTDFKNRVIQAALLAWNSNRQVDDPPLVFYASKDELNQIALALDIPFANIQQINGVLSNSDVIVLDADKVGGHERVAAYMGAITQKTFNRVDSWIINNALSVLADSDIETLRTVTNSPMRAIPNESISGYKCRILRQALAQKNSMQYLQNQGYDQGQALIYLNGLVSSNSRLGYLYDEINRQNTFLDVRYTDYIASDDRFDDQLPWLGNIINGGQASLTEKKISDYFLGINSIATNSQDPSTQMAVLAQLFYMLQAPSSGTPSQREFSDNVRKRAMDVVCSIAPLVRDPSVQLTFINLLGAVLLGGPAGTILERDPSGKVREGAAKALRLLAPGLYAHLTDLTPQVELYLEVTKRVLTFDGRDPNGNVRFLMARGLVDVASYVRAINAFEEVGEILDVMANVFLKEEKSTVRKMAAAVVNRLSVNIGTMAYDITPSGRKFVDILDMLLIQQDAEIRKYAADAYSYVAAGCALLDDQVDISAALIYLLQEDSSNDVKLYAARGLCALYNNPLVNATIKTTIEEILQNSAIEQSRKVFPVAYINKTLGTNLQSKITGANKKVLWVDNGRDGMGDQIVRNNGFLTSLLEANPSLTITVVTDKPYLYDNSRINVLDLNSTADPMTMIEIEMGDTTYNVVVSVGEVPSSINSLRDNNQDAAWFSLRSFDSAQNVDNAMSGSSYGMYIDPDGLGLRQYSIYPNNTSNFYGHMYALRLLFGLATPADTSSVLIKEGSAEQVSVANWLQENGIEADSLLRERPLILINGIGGQREGKGFSDMGKLVALINVIASRNNADILIVDNSNFTSEIYEAINDPTYMLYDVRERIRVIPPPTEAGKSKWLKYFINYSDMVVTVEGGLMHMAQALNKPYLALLSSGNSGEYYRFFPPHADLDMQREFTFSEPFDYMSVNDVSSITVMVSSIMLEQARKEITSSDPQVRIDACRLLGHVYMRDAAVELINFISGGESENSVKNAAYDALKTINSGRFTVYDYLTANQTFFDNFENGAHAGNNYIVAGTVVIVKAGLSPSDTNIALAEGLTKSYFELMKNWSLGIETLEELMTAAGFADETAAKAGLASFARQVYETYKSGGNLSNPLKNIFEIQQYFKYLSTFIQSNNITTDPDLPASFNSI